jgi:hypothetical protein
MHKLFFLCFVLLFAGCHSTSDINWEYEVGDQVRHISGSEAVVVDRNHLLFDSAALRYFIRYRNNAGSLETLRVIAEEIELMED